jgi:hypothetical protein
MRNLPPDGVEAFAVITFTPVRQDDRLPAAEALLFAGTSSAILELIKTSQLSCLP